jgi:hypothetical protein
MWDQQDNPKTALITAVEDAFSSGDPAVAAKRAAFLQLTPSDIFHQKGTPVALERAVARKAAQRFTFSKGLLSFYLPAGQDVHLEVFDMQGKVAVDRDLGKQAPGAHTVYLSDRRFPAGIYVARINSGEWSGCFRAY